MPKITFAEITPELWPDFEALFGANGACGGCWCQSWRVPSHGRLWDEIQGDKAKQMTKDLIQSGRMTGLIAFEGNTAVGWCSYGPREDYAFLAKKKAYARDDIDGVWCINCFFVDKDYRHRGLAKQMLAAALKFIRRRKVSVVEAYPVPLTKDGKKLPGAFVYAGPLKMFEDAGFEIIQRHSHSSPLVRKAL